MVKQTSWLASILARTLLQFDAPLLRSSSASAFASAFAFAFAFESPIMSVLTLFPAISEPFLH